MGLFFNVLRGRRLGILLLGGLLTGGAGALLSSVLQHFFDRSRENRQARPIASHEVEEALGEERIQWLIKQTGLTRGEIIGGLSFPTEEEAERFGRYS